MTTDTLPDLRVTIAESMEALARAMPIGTTRADQLAEVRTIDRLTAGAQTLRWSAEREAVSCDALRADLDVALDELEAMEEQITRLVTTVENLAPRVKPVKLRTELLAAVRPS